MTFNNSAHSIHPMRAGTGSHRQVPVYQSHYALWTRRWFNSHWSCKTSVRLGMAASLHVSSTRLLCCCLDLCLSPPQEVESVPIAMMACYLEFSA